MVTFRSCTIGLTAFKGWLRAVRGVAVLSLGLLLGTSINACAQDVDWVANITDAGSDPTPAGGLITYQVTVTNNGFDPAPANTL